MKKKIFMNYGEIKRIAEEFSVSDVTVRNALGFKTESYLSREIRRRALELGGREVEMGCAAPADME